MRDLVREFKAIYHSKGAEDLKSQVPFLSALADIYVKRAETSSMKWMELLKVSIDEHTMILPVRSEFIDTEM